MPTRKPTPPSPGTRGLADSLAELKRYADQGMTVADVKAHYRRHHPDRVRTYCFRDPGRHTPAMVRRLRTRMGMTQPLFARMIGASAILVQSWERGVREPSAMARRLLDAISRDPPAWLDAVIDRKAG